MERLNMEILPTVFLKGESEQNLHQLVNVKIELFDQPISLEMGIESVEFSIRMDLGLVSTGQSEHEIFIPEVVSSVSLRFALYAEGAEVFSQTLAWNRPRHWTVHVVQSSHHDAGYTDLQSLVFREHSRFLDEAIDWAEMTESYPKEAKFRMQIEQTWSLLHYLEQAKPERASKMIEFLKSGRFEVGAFFGNMITELCGPETLARALYPAFGLKRKYGIPLASAEHNDITGFSWGVSQVLADAGIKLFIPGIPLYYEWNRELQLQSCWNTDTLFGGCLPGAFWWEAPSGSRILLWCGNNGCGGDSRPSMPGLADRLLELKRQGYLYQTLRWVVSGGNRDNSPYLKDYSDTILHWNESWAYPRLVSSTNAAFYEDIVRELPTELPVFRGELPGQDYPCGAISTAAPTAQNRNNHNLLISAEKWAVAAEIWTGHRYDAERLAEAYKETLWHDEHTWGHHFPCGPAAQAAEYEKAAHAYRAAALAQDVSRKTMARIADHIELDTEDIHLIVFNPLSSISTGPIRMSLREIDNCGSEMVWIPQEKDPQSSGFWKGVILSDRWPIHPPLAIVEGAFELIDLSSGKTLPFQIVELEGSDETVPYASQRYGIGSGTRRYGFFESPLGLKRDLIFVAEAVPANGYKTYRLVQASTGETQHRQAVNKKSVSIENEFYRVSADERTGSIVSIFDKAASRELIDSNALHPFHSLVVRSPLQEETISANSHAGVTINGPIVYTLKSTSQAYGHPKITQCLTLYRGLKSIYLETRVLKDATPLLDVHLSFPFAMKENRFRYEGVWSALAPVQDFLPGAFADALTVQNWIKVTDGSYHIIWSSLDAPVVSLSKLWPGSVSPAHRCAVDPKMKPVSQRSEDFSEGWIYSSLFYNNVGTNFAVSQTGDLLFRYVLTSGAGDASDSEAGAFGWQSVLPMETMLTKKRLRGHLPIANSLFKVEGLEIVLLNCKKAEDGHGYIIRLFNQSDSCGNAKLFALSITIAAAYLTNIVEEIIAPLALGGESFIQVNVPGRGIATVKIIGS